MKTTFKVLAVLALLVTVLGPQEAAASANVYRFKQKGVEANLTSVDESGCVYTWVWLLASEQMFRNPKAWDVASSGVIVHIIQYDYCNMVGVAIYGDETLSEDELQINSSLNTARLTTTMTLADWDMDPSVEVTIDLTWKGATSIRKEKSHLSYSFAGYHINRQSRSDFRYAEVTGMIFDGTRNFIPDTAFGESRIFDAKEGEASHGPE